MKIISLRFKNLNSLYGEWAIDFTSDEFVANGIFAITGQTGAGKSTILDALCLALYGETPRLGKIAGDVNNLMSRHTSECSSEVVFETAKGQFIATWSQRRARNSIDGKLQDYKHEVAYLHGELIENKRSLVIDKIIEITGMDFARFTQSMLLAQGGFDKFLKAPTEEKSEILEQITGTDIYSKISKQVFETAKFENQKLDKLNSEIQGIDTLQPDEEDTLRKQINEFEIQKQAIDTEIKAQREIKNWFARIAILQNDKINAELELENIAQKKQEFAPKMELLRQANLAQEFEGEFVGLNTMRIKFAEINTQLSDLNAKIANLAKTELNLRAEAANAQENFEKTEQYQATIAPKIHKTIEIDATILHQEESLQQLQSNLSSIESDRDANIINKKNLEDAIKEQNKKYEELSLYLKTHDADAKIGEKLVVLEGKGTSIKTARNKIDEQQKALAGLQVTVLNEKNNLDDLKQNHTKHVDDETEVNNKIAHYSGKIFVLLDGRTRKEIELEKELVTEKKTNAQIIATLEQHRAKLEDGKPCVLCGATDHPYANGNIPKTDGLDDEIKFLSTLLEKINEAEGELKKLNDTKTSLTIALQKLDSEILLKTSIISGFEKSITQLIHEIDLEQSSLQKLESEFSEIIAGFKLGVSENVVEQLRERFNVFEATQQKFKDCQIDLNSMQIRFETLVNEFEKQNQAFENEKTKLVEFVKNLDEIKRQRKELFGDKNPIIESQNINKSLEGAREKNTKSIAQLNETLQAITHYEDENKRLKVILIDQEEQLKQTESGFVLALETKGFGSEEEYKNAVLDKSKRTELAKYSRELEAIEIKTQSLLQDALKKLEKEIALSLCDGTQVEVEHKLAMLDANFMEIAEKIITIRTRLEANEKSKLALKDKYTAIEKQKNECAKWQMLNNLIGSADGKKFRNFAQGLTFDIMVAHANQELMKMNERYLLARDVNDKSKPLELNVIDNFQAGQLRPVKNLSGGESFLISLALALGLSKMASSKVRVDSLFLDEGFGTLDEETLETALETLSRLHQNGKLIGVISHVSALKEKITTQIKVTPISGGKSKLSGAGVSAI
ncbi:AAA family ATPase [Pseudaquidulcibacter saccharophilus]|uniref:AAA family ATPase n=1 Tax=Pseudaquidulcibacter saccharophilus TaxID=2831900 RepID=UPI001EFF4B8D|nr:SbcC/MukB-like Walker B domain-containing protein [Pseudaquidulcibacter saccharophilus]